MSIRMVMVLSVLIIVVNILKPVGAMV
jgi:hypothetical protein